MASRRVSICRRTLPSRAAQPSYDNAARICEFQLLVVASRVRSLARGALFLLCGATCRR